MFNCCVPFLKLSKRKKLDDISTFYESSSTEKTVRKEREKYILIPGEVSNDEWEENLKVYQPFEDEQLILPELANCLSVKALLRMCDLTYKTEMRANAESMSPTGDVPFLRSGTFVIAGIDSIIDFLRCKGLSLSTDLSKAEKADMRAYMSLIKIVLTNAELHLSWCDSPTFSLVTKPRFSTFLPWPVYHILCWQRKQEIREKLNAVDWHSKNKHDVYEEVNNCCHSLSEKLGEQNYMCGEKPTELDALVFGHLYAILSTSLPDNKLSSVVREYQNLTDFCSRIHTQYFQKKIEDDSENADTDDRFLAEEDELLIALLGDQGILRDIANIKHKNARKKYLVWTKIEKRINKTKSQSKQRWESIQYHFKKQKMENSTDSTTLLLPEFNEEMLTSGVNDSIDSVISSASSSKGLGHFTQLPNKLPVKTTETDYNLQELINLRREDRQHLKKYLDKIAILNKYKDDETVLFFKTMIATVKKFNPDLAAEVKKEIFKLVMDFEAINRRQNIHGNTSAFQYDSSGCESSASH